MSKNARKCTKTMARMIYFHYIFEVIVQGRSSEHISCKKRQRPALNLWLRTGITHLPLTVRKNGNKKGMR